MIYGFSCFYERRASVAGWLLSGMHGSYTIYPMGQAKSQGRRKANAAYAFTLKAASKLDSTAGTSHKYNVLAAHR